MRLHGRLTLHFLLVLGVVGVATAVIFALGRGGPPGHDVAERVGRHAAGLAAEAWGDPARLQARLGRMHDDLDVDVVAHDLAGRPVARAGRPAPSLRPEHEARLREGASVVLPRRWLVATPVRDSGGAVVGWVAVSTRPRPEGPRHLLPFLALAAVIAIVGLATGPLARRISRPVERLTEGTRRLGAGDLAHRVPAPPRRRWRRARHRDEIDELTAAFNDMAARIERLVHGHRELLANVSHELRSPLARIRVALALLPRAGDADARLRDLEEDVAELDRLIDDLLTSSRLAASGLAATPAPVDVADLLATVARRAARDPRVAGRELRVAPAPPLTVMADRLLLERAVWNLVDNAARHGAPPITLAATAEDGRLVVSVSDEGPGIPAAERDRVLEAFETGDRARTPGRGQGFGLGLTLARQVAEAHGGALTLGPARVEAGGERGCRVTLALPLAPR